MNRMLDEKEIDRIEKKLSERFNRPIKISIDQERSVWYNIERLTLDLKYMSKYEFDAISKDERCIGAMKMLLVAIQSITKEKVKKK